MARKDIIDTEARTPAENAKTFMMTICIYFAAVMLAFLIYWTVSADEGSRGSFIYCWSILGACAVTAVLHFVFFTPTVIKRMTYPLRLFLFGICLYAVLAVLAVTMSWFPTGNVGGWAIFTIIYLVTFAVITAMFAVKHKRDERVLNQGLSDYLKNND